ncbi:N-acetylglucosaminyl-phosphatidylinositol de-N-acetylase [Diplocarpon rosae]|nr:N-acetylglucosaminyl-phosphatidylinositol de-N-acetylase [Diplocarpon rosae]
MQWFTILAIPLVIISAWLYTVSIAHARFPRLRNKRICLLIAHPDDEAMFFAPTLLALTEPALGNHVKILCLSSGDSDGLGETRKKELVKSGMALGLRKADDVFVIESPEFPDSIITVWDKQKIATLLSSAFAPNLSNPMKNKSADAPTATIDVLITFDASGVSSHPNHISLFHGARHFIACAQSAMTTAHKSQMRWFRWGWIGLSRYMVVNDLRLEKIAAS